MFDIGFQELLVIGVVSLLIMGPERLPGAIRTTTMWIAKLRNSFAHIKAEIDREIGADEIKQQIHNASIMQNLEQAKSKISKEADAIKSEVNSLTADLPYDISDVLDKHDNNPKNRSVSETDIDTDKKVIGDSGKTNE